MGGTPTCPVCGNPFLTGDHSGCEGKSEKEKVGGLKELFANFEHRAFEELVKRMAKDALSSPEVRAVAQTAIVAHLAKGDSYRAKQVQVAVGMDEGTLRTPEAQKVARAATAVKLRCGEWFQADDLMKTAGITSEGTTQEMQTAAKDGVLSELKKGDLFGARILFEHALTRESTAALVGTPEYTNAVEKAVIKKLLAPLSDTSILGRVDHGPEVLKKELYVTDAFLGSEKVTEASYRRFGTLFERFATGKYEGELGYMSRDSDWRSLREFVEKWDVPSEEVVWQTKRLLIDALTKSGYSLYENVLTVPDALGKKYALPEAFLRDPEVQDAAVAQAQHTLGLWPHRALEIVRKFGIPEQKLSSPEFRRTVVYGCAQQLGWDKLEEARLIAEGFHMTDAERQSDEIQGPAREALASLLAKRDFAQARQLVQEFRISQ